MKFEVYQTKICGVLSLNKWRWRLIGRNGKTVATCLKSFENKSKCLDSILAVISVDHMTEVHHLD